MSEPTLRHVAITICSACLDGEGGECHTPGCALWLHRTDTLRVHPELYSELPSEKPLPDAPGWWIRRIHSSRNSAPSTSIVYIQIPIEPPYADAWYGPITLPWEVT